MDIQSLSIVVPNDACINKCKFCVSRMHCNQYPNYLTTSDQNLEQLSQNIAQYQRAINFARSNGCNTVMLTGTSEPQQNRQFLVWFGLFQMMLPNPFQWVEIQTTGVGITDPMLAFLKNHIHVNVISLSLSSLNSQNNCDIIGCPEKLRFQIEDLCTRIKQRGFTLRLSLNLTDEFKEYFKTETDCKRLFNYCKNTLQADQITFRLLYADHTQKTEQSEWVEKHGIKNNSVWIHNLRQYIAQHGNKLGILPYGAIRYSINGISTILDDDCMAKAEPKDTYKYLVLRPDGHLYTSWDDPGSMLF